jgi:hypothetical protein
MHTRGVKSSDLVSRYAGVSTMNTTDRAVNALRDVLVRDAAIAQNASASDHVFFVDLLPAYALADAAETMDPRLVSLTGVWGSSPMVDVCIFVAENEDAMKNGDTLHDAGRDLSRYTIVVTKEDVFRDSYGKKILDVIEGKGYLEKEERDERGGDCGTNARVRKHKDGKVSARRRESARRTDASGRRKRAKPRPW